MPEAKVVMEFKKSSFSLLSAELLSLRIELGDKVINVPKEVLAKVRRVRMDPVDFCWVNRRYYFRIGLEEAHEVGEMAEFIVADGKLVELRFVDDMEIRSSRWKLDADKKTEEGR